MGASPVNDRPIVEELEHLYTSLTQDERDQLLQALLVAAHGGEALEAEAHSDSAEDPANAQAAWRR